MHLFCCHTSAHRILFEKVFAPSVPEGFDLRSTLVDEAGGGDYLSPEFLRCIRKKLALVQESLEQFQGGIVVWSDVDIRFVDIDPRDLESLLFSSGADILFQRESPRMGDVNTGFFVCRANSAVQSLFGQVQKLLEENPAINERMAMNQLLSSRSGKSVPVWNFLPKTYYARPQEVLPSTTPITPKDRTPLDRSWPSSGNWKHCFTGAGRRGFFPSPKESQANSSIPARIEQPSPWTTHLNQTFPPISRHPILLHQ